jgi:hypothetical protein
MNMRIRLCNKIPNRIREVGKTRQFKRVFRKHFRDMNILPLRSQYTYSLMIFAIKNRGIFNTNSDCYEIDTGTWLIWQNMGMGFIMAVRI